MNADEIFEYFNEYLDVGGIEDYCPNGLQVQSGSKPINKIVTAVSASEELILKAVELKADLIVTHHGLFWEKTPRTITGAMRRKIKLLLENDIALAAYHLPLDFHHEIGNNVQLAHHLELSDQRIFSSKTRNIKGVTGKTAISDIRGFCGFIEEKLKRKPLLFEFGKKEIQTIAIITGGAQGYFEDALMSGADVFVTGEVSEHNYGFSQENRMHFISAGHYATERFGILALGEKIQEKWRIPVQFVELDNPV
ncbi:MAG: Nif3-like dinuclear metal center hexameric protein [Deltaproteobacteria bacterium]|nr:Nif3-like dinuclear metal center hexameric protein [Deltaproteobacteria bacterium]